MSKPTKLAGAAESGSPALPCSPLLIALLQSVVGTADAIGVMESLPGQSAGECKIWKICAEQLQESIAGVIPNYDEILKAAHEENAEAIRAQTTPNQYNTTMPETTQQPASDAPTCSLLRAWKISPCGDTRIDTIYVLDDGKWDTVMRHAEYSLEQQTEADGSGNLERPWDAMEVTITGVLLTPEEWEELCDEEY